jgi:hypothetical protein
VVAAAAAVVLRTEVASRQTVVGMLLEAATVASATLSRVRAARRLWTTMAAEAHLGETPRAHEGTPLTLPNAVNAAQKLFLLRLRLGNRVHYQ